MVPPPSFSERFFLFVLLPLCFALFGTVGYLTAAYGGALAAYFLLLSAALGALVVWVRLVAHEQHERLLRLECSRRYHHLTGHLPDRGFDRLTPAQVALLQTCTDEELPRRMQQLAAGSTVAA